MKSSFMNLFLTVLLISFPKLIQAQDVSFGFGLNMPMGGKSSSIGLGVHLVNEYSFQDQYSARLSARASIAGLKNMPYNGIDMFGQAEYEAAFLYYFMKESFRPFAGLGLEYYVPLPSTSSNPNYTPSGYDRVSGNNIYNTFGMIFIAGLKFASQNFFSYGFDMKYSIVKTNWSANMLSSKGDYIKDLGKIDLSQLTMDVNFIFNF